MRRRDGASVGSVFWPYGLDLALFVDRQHQGVLGWVEVEADDIFDLGDKVGIVGGLEAPHQMRLEPVLVPDALHPVADAHLSSR